ncbi:MAG: hypothetical protein AAFQ41_12265 [Cyanobacteria bacterium J06623_7]
MKISTVLADTIVIVTSIANVTKVRCEGNGRLGWVSQKAIIGL